MAKQQRQFSVKSASVEEKSIPTQEVTEETQSEVVETEVETTPETLIEERKQVALESVYESTAQVHDPVQEAKEARATAHISNGALNMAEVEAKLSPAGRALLGHVQEYMKNMVRRRPIDAVHGVKWQETLYRTLRAVICTTNEEDFQVLFPALLVLFHENRENVFHEDMLNRFASDVRLNDAQRSAYRRIMNMMMALGNPATRKINLKSVDLTYTTKYDINDIGTNRLVNFFSKWQ